jgi:cell division septal protein FtsQ
MSRQKYVSDTLKIRKKKRTKIKVYIFSFLSILFISLCIYLINLPNIQIKNIDIQGTIFIEKENIEQIVRTQLSEKNFLILPKSNIFLFSKKELYDRLKQDPAIVDVKINKDYFKGIQIAITEQEKRALYCRDESYSDCFYVNTEGMMYSKVDEYVIAEQEIIIISENNNLQIKDTILDQSVYVGLMQFIRSIAQKNIQTAIVYIKNDGRIELKTRTGVLIINSKFDDFKKNFTNFVALFEQGILTEESFNTLEYVDLRFGNKVFYKNKTN